MVRLSLLRHAKSAWDNRGLDDFDRPLAPRGRKAAPRMGRYIAAENLEPDLVLCSAAARARQTLDLILPCLSSRPEIGFREDLYMASPRQLIAALQGLSGPVAHAMLLGHNPGMHALAASLAGAGDGADAGALDAMKVKFPTAALAIFDFDAGWGEIAPGAGKLRLFMVPERLPPE